MKHDRTAMSLELHVQDAERIGDLVEVLHDQWFSVEGIVFNQANSILRVPFFPTVQSSGFMSRASSAPEPSQWLEIRHVQRYTLEDTEKVGLYDLNEIQYDPIRQSISLTTGIPLTFVITVSRFEVLLRPN